MRDKENKLLKILRVYRRARSIAAEANLYFNGTVHNCARVSAVNKSLAFAVHRVGIFGGPVIEQIDRPKVVSLTEHDRCVIVRDGYVFELKSEIR